MKTILPNYNECITNLSNSILKHFNIKTYHNTIDELDKILDKDYKNVIVVLCDGMGSILLDEMLDKEAFLVKNRIKTITSVYPPTTTAATTSMLSSLNPNEHGWLGWDLYFKKENKTISMFINTIKDTNIQAETYNVARNTFPYESIVSKINKNYSEVEYVYNTTMPVKINNEYGKIIENDDDKNIIVSDIKEVNLNDKVYSINNTYIGNVINIKDDNLTKIVTVKGINLNNLDYVIVVSR